jgi:hypothetical protein
MELGDSIPTSQKPLAHRHDRTNPSYNLHRISLMPILFSHLHLGLQNGIFTSAFPTKILCVFLISVIKVRIFIFHTPCVCEQIFMQIVYQLFICRLEFLIPFLQET